MITQTSNQNTQNQDLLDLEQKSQITIRASPVIGRDINIKVKIFKKAFKNIDQDEKAQAKAFKSFKALSLQNIKLYQQKENYEH